MSGLKEKCLTRIDFLDRILVGEEVIFKDKISPIRAFEVDNAGNIFLIRDDAAAGLWKLSQ